MTAVTPDRFYAVDDGIADCTAAFEKCFSKGENVELPGWRYNIANADNIIVPPGITVSGPGTIVLGNNTNTIFNCNGNADITFDDINIEAPASFAGKAIYSGVNCDNLRILDSEFKFNGLSGFSIYLEQISEGFQIEGNKQHRGGGLLYAVGGRGGVINDNCSVDAVRAIQCNGGQSHTFNGNHINGGLTGILNLSFRQIGQNNLMMGHTITGNVCTDQSEEGITFDCNGNTPNQWPENATLPIGTVASITSNATNIIVTLSETGLPTNVLLGYMAVFLNGGAVGHNAIITASGSASFTIPRSAGNIISLVSVGDKVLFTTGFFENVINGNTVRNSGTYGIGFWGSAWHNTISDNQLIGCKVGVLIASVTSPGSAGSSVQAYSGCNKVKDNTISCLNTAGDETTTSGIKLYTQQFGAGIPAIAAQNPGNKIIDNDVIGRDIEILNCTTPIVRDNTAPSYLATNTTGLVQSNNFSYLTPVTIT